MNIPPASKLKSNFIDLIYLIILSLCTTCKNSSTIETAGMSFCDCVAKQKNIWNDSTSEKCIEEVARHYKKLRIYLETRDTLINDIYDEETVEEVLDFGWKFGVFVDSCSSLPSSYP